MPSVSMTNDDVIDAVCRMVEPIVMKGALPREDCNRYGIDVLRHKENPYLLMFHFITQDLLEVNFEFDLHELEKRGAEYIQHINGLLLDQLEKGRAERQKDHAIVFNTGSHAQKEAEKNTQETSPPKLNPVADATRRVLH